METIITSSYIYSKSIKASRSAYEERTKKLKLTVIPPQETKPDAQRGGLLVDEGRGLNMGPSLEMAIPNTIRQIDMLNYELMGKRFQKHQISVNVATGAITKTEATDVCKSMPAEPLNYASFRGLEFFFLNDKRIILRREADATNPEKNVVLDSQFQPYYCGGRLLI